MITTPATLTHKEDSPSQQVSYVLFQPETTFTFSEGQFVMIEAEINGQVIKRPYSIATTHKQLQEEKILGVIVKKTSDKGMSDRLTQKIQLGDQVTLKGPAGHYTNPETHTNYLLISTGSGLSPNFGLFQHLIGHPESYKKIVTLFGERYAADLIPLVQDTFQTASSATVQHFFFLSQEAVLPTGYRKWYIQEGLSEAVDIVGTQTTCFVCGSPVMVTDVLFRLQELGIAREDIVVEKY